MAAYGDLTACRRFVFESQAVSHTYPRKHTHEHVRSDKVLAETVRSKSRITVLTGAGISAESGIPTFRGPEGFWTVGSREYHPQEMATFTMFSKDPESVWVWYLYRMGLCKRAARPNAGHLALTSMEEPSSETGSR